mmetsp:Transcript_11817/g.31816  ORF Transcript_11817/g.31816 Transcript_11817/m.31816 type:complete len:234 (+) Transcript_11817:1692-2393(+)
MQAGENQHRDQHQAQQQLVLAHAKFQVFWRIRGQNHIQQEGVGEHFRKRADVRHLLSHHILHDFLSDGWVLGTPNQVLLVEVDGRHSVDFPIPVCVGGELVVVDNLDACQGHVLVQSCAHQALGKKMHLEIQVWVPPVVLRDPDLDLGRRLVDPKLEDALCGLVLEPGERAGVQGLEADRRRLVKPAETDDADGHHILTLQRKVQGRVELHEGGVLQLGRHRALLQNFRLLVI